MIRKCTDEDISNEELEKVINHFCDNYHEYIITYVMPDNTMDPEFHQNDCIILREQNKIAKDGFYCVMEKGQDIATIRKLITINDGIMVMPLNLGSDFKPTTYLKGTVEFENFKIIGSVVQVKRYYD